MLYDTNAIEFRHYLVVILILQKTKGFFKRGNRLKCKRKIKIKMKTIRSKTFIKNDRIFLGLYASKEEEFLKPILRLQKEFSLPKLGKINRWIDVLEKEKNIKEGWQKVLRCVLETKNKRETYLKNLSTEKQRKFFTGVERIRIRNKLGKEWTYCLMDIVISHFFIPPIYNLHIEANKEKKKVSIEINPDTSLADIKEAWHSIKKAKKKVFGKIARKKVTNKWLENFVLFAKQLELKRSKKTVRDEELSADHKITTDLALVAELFEDAENISPETDKKRAARIRQIRSRMKK